jgi:hypothetical protein
MRVVAGVIGGGAAALGAIAYVLTVVVWIAISAFAGFAPTTLVDLAFIGTTAAALLFACLGLVGALRVFRGDPRRGARLMLLSAIGIAIAFAVQPVLVATTGNYGLPEQFQAGPSGFQPGGFFVAFAPAAALLVGALLAFASATRPTAES